MVNSINMLFIKNTMILIEFYVIIKNKFGKNFTGGKHIETLSKKFY